MGGERADTKILCVDGREVPLTVRRTRRARHIGLRIDDANDAVWLVLPPRAPLAEGLDFARHRAGWIIEQLDELPPRVAFVPGARVPYLGEPHVIGHAPAARRGVWREPGAIRVSGRAEHLSRRVADFLKAEARRELTARAHLQAGRVERRVARISLRDMRSRWGSCSAEGDISFSWRLILAPEAVLDYVVAHEVAHLVHLDHGPRFWQLVGRLTGDVAWCRRWLRENGRRLLRYG